MLKKLICIGYGIILVSIFSGCGYNKHVEIEGITTEKVNLLTDNSERVDETNIKEVNSNILGKENIDIIANASENMKETKSEELADAILGEWKPVSAKHQSGESISLRQIWGSGISYGGTLEIYEDGSYTEYIGILGETDHLEGNWNIEDDQIVLTSKTNHKKNVTVINENVIDIDYEEDIVRFERIKYNDVILDGLYAFPASDVFWNFSKDGKVSQSGNIHVNLGTYKTTEENIIEIHYITEKVWNDNDNAEINDIDIYEYIFVNDNDVYLMDAEGGKSKLERYRDVNKEDFE